MVCMETHRSEARVKLNNPLMGTETNGPKEHMAFQWVVVLN